MVEIQSSCTLSFPNANTVGNTRDDQSAPYRNSLIFADKLNEAGIEFTLHLCRHGEHGLSLADNRVYGSNLPDFSQDASHQPEACSLFFLEVGFHFSDVR